MKALLVVLGFLGLTVSAQAGVVIQKAMDGSVATCTSTTKNDNNDKIIRINLDTLTSDESEEQATIAVSLVKCENGQWVPETEPNLQKYTAPNGQKVTVTLKDYELFMLNDKGQVVLNTSLDYLNKAVAKQTTQIKLQKTKAAYQDFTIFVRFTKTVEAEGYKEASWATFGEFVVRLTNDQAETQVP